MTLGSADALIGRARELELLGDLVRGVTSGVAATVLVEGEAGIGKSRLLSCAIDTACESGVSVFRGEAHPLERTRPFGALVEALDLRGGSSDPRRAGVGRLLAAETAEGHGSPPAGALQFRAVEEIIDLIEVLSDQGPVFLALDDLHWADESTLLAFRWMTRQLTQVPLLLLATLRPSPRSPELDQLLADSVASGATVIDLQPLGRSDVAALVGAELGLPPGPKLAGLVDRAAGNPLWVVELLRSMSAEGAIEVNGTYAEVTGADLPGSLRQLLVRRLGYLPAETVTALRSASVLGDSFSLTDLSTITGRRAGDLVEELRPAFASGLLADSGGMLVFRHQLVCDAIYEDIPQSARVALHREASRVLAAAGAPLSQVASQVVLGAVPGDVEAAQSLRRAAAEAAARAPAVAVELLGHVERLLPAEHPERDVVLADLVENMLRAGTVAAGAALAESVLARSHDPAVDRRLRVSLVGALSLLNRPLDLIRHAEAALRDSPDLPLSDQAFFQSMIALARAFSGDPASGELAARRAIELAEPAADTAITVWSLTMLSTPLAVQGRCRDALETNQRAVRLAVDAPDDLGRHRNPFFMLSMTLSEADRFDEAADACRQAAEECRTLENVWILSDVLLISAEVRFQLGEWEEAEPELAGGIESALEHGNLSLQPRCRAYLAIIAAARGDLGGAELALAPMQNVLTTERPPFGAEFVGYAAAVLAEITGRPTEAFELLHHFWKLGVGDQNRYSHRFLAPALVRLAIAQQELALAGEVTEAAERSAALAGEVPSVQSAALRCRGLLERDPEVLVRSVELARRGRRVLDLAGTCEDAASVLASHGRLGDARVLLAEALDHYEALGASRFEARAHAALRGIGARRGRRGSRERPLTGWDSLTKSEQAVAELVAEGLTNREVAQRLYISPHTVNTHLRHIFGKLEITTRAALAAKARRTQDHAFE
jgi:DNA-binding CsgD family transcriptional regulator/tetratricopeptide (TPR) repeat protein